MEADQQLEPTPARLKSGIDRLSDIHAEKSARNEAGLIVYDLDMLHVHTLSVDEVSALAVAGLAQQISKEDVRSFCHADLIVTAVDDAGLFWYVAVEASYTADERDIARALRNADYLTRLTGQPTRAVVAAVEIDDRIREILQRGNMHGYALARDRLAVYHVM